MRSIIRDERVLMPDHPPKRLVHREDQLRRISGYLSGFLENPGSSFSRAVIYGPPGTGKTASLRYIARMYALDGHNKVRYVHVSCYSNRSYTSIIKSAAAQLGMYMPPRGLSAYEYIDLFVAGLNARDLYVLFVLDDAHRIFDEQRHEALAGLIRLGAEPSSFGGKYRLALVIIVNDLSTLEELDKSARSILGNPIVRFPPYTSSEIYDILMDRAEDALHRGTYSDDIIEMISSFVGVDGADGGSGDARIAIDVLWKAAKYAEMDGAHAIYPEHVRRAIRDASIGIRVEELASYYPHQLLLLLAIIRALKRRPTIAYVPFGNVEEEYKMVCDEFGEKPRVHSLLWEFLQELKKSGVVETKPSGKGRRGRTTLISISRESLDSLENVVTSILRSKLR